MTNIIIESIESNINQKISMVENEIDSLMDNLPISREVYMGNFTISKEYFEPEDEKEKEYYIKSINNCINNMLISYCETIITIYSKIEKYFSLYINDLEDYNKFILEEKIKYKSNLYKKVRYLNYKNILLFNECESKKFDYIESVIRPKRNKLVHEELILNSKDKVEEILMSENISSNLLFLEISYKYGMREILLIIKDFIFMIENKIKSI